MLITCPECKTTYDAPSTADNPEQKVRCTKCGCVWQPAAEVIDIPLIDFSLQQEEESIPETPLPAFRNYFDSPKKQDFNFIKWLKPLYFFSLFCITASIYLFFFHPSKRIAVTLQPVSYEIVQKDYKSYLLLQTGAYNNTDAEIYPQTFTVRFADKDDKTLTTVSLASPVETLKPKSFSELSFQIERPPSKTAKVVLTLTKMIQH